ncbi:MAG: EAL domain-containing protein [Alphaproteobacteria bacterium]|nr:EAL domain-containing protein [Alphaproteobacteria bacterium]MBV9370450.1 EAL domain-containing protein [Alphaproteobacteria bacterium]MBV9900040.1 EAL domain-containing protein [Alphaproteobacteria bacterium]
MLATLGKISNRLLSVSAGVAAFVLTLLGFLLLGTLNQQIAASLLIGLLALVVVWMAAERPNSRHARAVQALIDRLLAVGRGDLASPAPPAVREELPALAAAVDGLFEQVRSTLDDVHAMAMYDPVTALPNRIHFRREAERLLAGGAGACSALLFIDLDGFKEVNDRLGHAHGDQVLAMVANRLRVVLKAEAEPGSLMPPLLARLAGDEFTMLLPDIPSPEEAERIARRALEALSEPYRSGAACSWMSASIGIALCPEHGADLTAVMKAADVAMYHAKASGRSRVCTYEPGLSRASEERAQTEWLLRQALARQELELGFDPRLCLRTGAILGAEALLRARPGTDAAAHELDRLAGQALAGEELGDWMVARVAEAAIRWREEALDHRLCLKLEPVQIERPGFADRLRAALAVGGPPPWRLEIELSEAVIAKADAATLSALAALRTEGITVTVSRFGSGQLALARIGDLPVDRVKLDPSLIADIAGSESARTIVSAVIQLVHALGCEAVAPGVERQEQLELLRAVGCDAVQGFLAADPLDEPGFVAWAAGQDCKRSLARA